MSSIEINGRVVDAQTGRPLNSPLTKPSDAHSKPTTSIDGVLRSGASADPSIHTNKLQAISRQHPTRSVKHLNKHSTQKSKTLVRHSLNKSLARQSSVNHHASVLSGQRQQIGPIPAKADISRLRRAESVHRHKLISKFSDQAASLFVKKSGHLPIVHPNKTSDKPHALSTPIEPESNDQAEPFSDQIDQATSHQAHRVSLPKGRAKWAKKFGLSRRGVNLASVSLAAAALIGFFAYQNVPNISLYIKSKNAKIAAGMPAYRPSGFSVGQIDSSPGQIVINFSSNTSDGRNFQITQRNSDWNSEALLANYVDPNYRGAYQVRQDHGKTIYIYQVAENSNATWVDGGVWYNIESRANLNHDQLNQMALSL